MIPKAIVLFAVATLHVMASRGAGQPLVDQCGEAGYYPKVLIPGDEYYIYSSESLDVYAGQKYCNWFTTCLHGGRPQLNCPLVEIPESENCSQDHIFVHTSINKFPKSFCGNKPIQEVSESDQMTVALVAPANTKGGRFLCKISCVRPGVFPAGQKPPAQPRIPEQTEDPEETDDSDQDLLEDGDY